MGILPEDNPNLGLHIDWNSGFWSSKGPYPLFNPNSKLKASRLSVSVKGSDLKSLGDAHMPTCDWITHLFINLWRARSDLFDYVHDAPLPYFAGSLASKFPNLEGLWLYDEKLSHNESEDNYSDSGLSFDCSMRRNAEDIAGPFPKLRYLRLTEHDYRVHRETGELELEDLDEWEGQVEGPSFFTVPRPSRWCNNMEHFDL